jgi:hypothetical protein
LLTYPFFAIVCAIMSSIINSFPPMFYPCFLSLTG